MSTDDDRSISTMPDGLWTQPAPTVPDLGDQELVQRVQIPAAMRYEYTPGSHPVVRLEDGTMWNY